MLKNFCLLVSSRSIMNSLEKMPFPESWWRTHLENYQIFFTVWVFFKVLVFTSKTAWPRSCCSRERRCWSRAPSCSAKPAQSVWQKNHFHKYFLFKTVYFVFTLEVVRSISGNSGAANPGSRLMKVPRTTTQWPTYFAFKSLD